ncbi:N-acetylglucosamine-6-phosphate deacetylase [Chryseolinea sp. T2]|uniref:N-acetylglucosamine-6-phosphate deacetylase n=1 Tax=Chryseolinea sp. T2 TaxID=3129255 RepID=UPI0030768C08
MSQRLKITNGKRILPSGKIEHGYLLIENGKIVGTGERDEPFSEALVIDAGQRYVSPGFIDIHVHGGAGHDFMDGTVEAFLAIANLHARHGTTAMLPTTLSASPDELDATLNAYEQSLKINDNGSCFIGMHLEGPYFAMAQRGAQDPRYIRDPDPAEYEAVIRKAPFIRRWSAAPELKGALPFGDFMLAHNVLPAAAHTDAIYEDVIEAFDHGYTLATHLYSGMSGVTRRNAFRYAGMIESAFIIDDMDVEIIADGVHLPAPLLKLIIKIKGPSRTALITDAMRAAGLPPGPSMLGSRIHGLPVIVEDEVAKLPDRSSFAGSVATADRLVRTMIRQAGVSLADAITMITATPARIMNVPTKGALSKGMDADVVVFDENINISKTIVGGRIIYDAASGH